MSEKEQPKKPAFKSPLDAFLKNYCTKCQRFCIVANDGGCNTLSEGGRANMALCLQVYAATLNAKVTGYAALLKDVVTHE